MGRSVDGRHGEPGMSPPDALRGDAASRTLSAAVPLIALPVAIYAAYRAHRQAPWIPVVYLGGLIVLLTAAWMLLRWTTVPRRERLVGLGAVALVVLALLPVPWMTASLDEPPGTAWRLDGNLTIEGELIDPPGDWYWLTVGRPPIVAELVSGWVMGSSPGKSLRQGGTAGRPEFNEPAAAAVGLRAAGQSIVFDLVIEASRPTVDGLPDHVVITHLNGIPVTSRALWRHALAGMSEANTFTASNGAIHTFEGLLLPYGRTELLDVPNQRLDAMIGGRLARTPPGRWFRGLALGRSHGLMVALVTYSHASGDDLAQGRVIAGTGAIRGDGTVQRIGGLRSKAGAAARLGADVLLVPAMQLHELEGFDADGMRLIPVSSLDQAVAALLLPESLPETDESDG